MAQGQLDITITEAQLVRIFDSLRDSQDLYVQLVCTYSNGTEKAVGRTETCANGNRNPHFNERFLCGRGGGKTLKFRIIVDHQWRSTTLCGECEYDLDDLWTQATEGPKKVSFPVFKKGEQTGVLHAVLGLKGAGQASAVPNQLANQPASRDPPSAGRPKPTPIGGAPPPQGRATEQRPSLRPDGPPAPGSSPMAARGNAGYQPGGAGPPQAPYSDGAGAPFGGQPYPQRQGGLAPDSAPGGYGGQQGQYAQNGLGQRQPQQATIPGGQGQFPGQRPRVSQNGAPPAPTQFQASPQQQEWLAQGPPQQLQGQGRPSQGPSYDPRTGQPAYDQAQTTLQGLQQLQPGGYPAPPTGGPPTGGPPTAGAGANPFQSVQPGTPAEDWWKSFLDRG